MNGGAVAYLTHSKAGRNGTEVTINSNSSYYTGGGSGTAYKTNTSQSSTGNLSGVYDLTGGAHEYVAAFNSAYSGTYFTGSSYLNASGTHFASNGGSSTKYATAYSNSTSTSSANFTVGTVSRTGDAIQEVWVSSNYGWFSDYAYFVSSNSPFFVRGETYAEGARSGVFCSRVSIRRYQRRQLQFSCSVSTVTLSLDEQERTRGTHTTEQEGRQTVR